MKTEYQILAGFMFQALTVAVLSAAKLITPSAGQQAAAALLFAVIFLASYLAKKPYWIANGMAMMAGINCFVAQIGVDINPANQIGMFVGIFLLTLGLWADERLTARRSK